MTAELLCRSNKVKKKKVLGFSFICTGKKLNILRKLIVKYFKATLDFFCPKCPQGKNKIKKLASLFRI